LGRKILILFAAAFLVRGAFALALRETTRFDDEAEYLRMAENIREGRGVIVSDGLKGYRPPLYPLVLAGLMSFGCGIVCVRLVQAALSAAVSVLVYLCGREVFDDAAGWRAGVISCVYPFFIFYTGFLLTEILFLFLSTAAVAILLRADRSPSPRWAAAAGVILGLAGLTRPAVYLFVPCAAVLLALPGGRSAAGLRKAAAMLLLFGLTISPWVIRNAVVFRKLIPGTTMGGWVFWEGNNPRSDGGPCRYFPEGILDVEETRRDAVLYRMTAEVIREDPSRFAGLLANKFRRFWNPVPNAAGYERPLYRAVSVAGFGLLLPFFVLGSALSLRNRRAWFFLSMIGVFTVFHMVYLASIRYRLSLEPFVIILAVAGFSRLAAMAREAFGPAGRRTAA